MARSFSSPLLFGNFSAGNPKTLHRTMNKRIAALALAGAAYYLFGTKKGKEVRRNIGSTAGNYARKMQDQYRSRFGGSQASGGAEPLDMQVG